MLFKDFCSIFSSNRYFVQKSGTILAFLVEGHSKNISVKLFWTLAIGVADVVLIFFFLSLLATASRLFAIAWGFTSGFSSQLFMRIFIRALLLNQTQCSTITVN